MDRYGSDVLGKTDDGRDWRSRGRPQSRDVDLAVGLLVEDASTGFTGEVQRWENGIVVLVGRRDVTRAFPIGAGFLIDGKPVVLTVPAKKRAGATHTASGSRAATGPEIPKVALPSRIFVEGRHDAELVEKIWGDDLRHVGVVVEYLGGIDDLGAVVEEFAPEPKRRLGVLVDHLVPGSKESRIVEKVERGRHGEHVLVTGHEFIDIWQAVLPDRLGLAAWPEVPRGEDWKHGICARLGWPHEEQADIARAWKHILSRATSYRDLDPKLRREVEVLIDFVTVDQVR